MLNTFLLFVTGFLVLLGFPELARADVLDVIDKALTMPEATIAIVAMVVEFLLRMFKTEKPISLLLGLVKLLELAVMILTKVVGIFSKLILLLHKVIPQRIGAPQPPASE